jgi:spore coat protein A
MGYNAVRVTGGVNTVLSHMAYLGPTVVTKQGTPIQVTIKNDLPAAGTDLFPQWGMMTDNSTVLHRHGGLQPALSDGTPDQGVAPGATRTNDYPNNQAAAPIWYHDHMDMTTSYMVYAGLAGYMPNTDTLEPGFNLPTGEFSKAYVVQDKSFNPDKSLCYNHLSPEFFGDTPVINGTISPKQAVQAQKYRFMFLNGSDSRFYNLSMKAAVGNPSTVAPRLTVVGSDEGYLLTPAPVTSLLLAPGERYTVVADFTGTTGNWVLSNNAATPYPGVNNDGIATADDAGALIPSLMRFDVTAMPKGTKDTSVIPTQIRETNNQVTAVATLKTAQLRTVQAGELAPGVPFLGDRKALYMFHDTTAVGDPRAIGAPMGTTENINLGSTEAWEMRNHSPDTHPMHTHLAEQRLVGRYAVIEWGYFDSVTGRLVTGPWGTQDPVTGNAFPTKLGAFSAAGAWESGPKDTFVSPPNMVTVWVATFTIPGNSVWHCHILSHEDMMMTTTSDIGNPVVSDGMMRPIHIQANMPQTQLPVVDNLNNLTTLVKVRAGFCSSSKNAKGRVAQSNPVPRVSWLNTKTEVRLSDLDPDIAERARQRRLQNRSDETQGTGRAGSGNATRGTPPPASSRSTPSTRTCGGLAVAGGTSSCRQRMEPTCASGLLGCRTRLRGN